MQLTLYIFLMIAGKQVKDIGLFGFLSQLYLILLDHVIVRQLQLTQHNAYLILKRTLEVTQQIGIKVLVVFWKN